MATLAELLNQSVTDVMGLGSILDKRRAEAQQLGQTLAQVGGLEAQAQAAPIIAQAKGFDAFTDVIKTRQKQDFELNKEKLKVAQDQEKESMKEQKKLLEANKQQEKQENKEEIEQAFLELQTNVDTRVNDILGSTQKQLEENVAEASDMIPNWVPLLGKKKPSKAEAENKRAEKDQEIINSAISDVQDGINTLLDDSGPYSNIPANKRKVLVTKLENRLNKLFKYKTTYLDKDGNIRSIF